MSEAPDDLRLAGEFPPATREQWRKLVDGVLKGASFEQRLVAKTYDGLHIEPLYPRKADARAIVGRAPGAAWTIMQRVDHPDPAAANAMALHDLENGATGLSMIFAGAVGGYGFGLAPNEAAIARALDGVHLDAGIALDLDGGARGETIAPLLAAEVKRRGTDPAATRIRFGLDPIGAAAVSGGATLPLSTLGSRLAAVVTELRRHGFGGPFAVADGRVIHNAGGSEAQELGYVLAVALAYLRAFETHGVALDAARGMLHFRLAADADELTTIAKFRALRRLWARVEQACGLRPASALVSAETAWRMMTRFDPYVNMLRATIAVVSAGLGGANEIGVLPFTLPRGLPDDFARRIARNTQLVLLEESNLAKVADPAAGSGGIEDLTDRLCRTAWSLFQEIERAGGAAAALTQGLIQQTVAAVRTERETAVAHRRDALTGTSDFPDLGEAPVAVLDAKPIAVPATAASFPSLASMRLAAPFEALRDASDRMLARTGVRPKIFLATLGKLADFTTRATFANNLYAAGGIEAVASDGYAGLDQMIAAFKRSGAKLACLCGSDAAYASDAAPAARALKTAGATHISMAGRPRDLDAALKAAGVETFIFVGCDVLATLKATHDMIGTSATG